FYDTRADRSTIPADTQQAMESLRKRLGSRPAFTYAYERTRDELNTHTDATPYNASQPIGSATTPSSAAAEAPYVAPPVYSYPSAGAYSYGSYYYPEPATYYAPDWWYPSTCYDGGFFGSSFIFVDRFGHHHRDFDDF